MKTTFLILCLCVVVVNCEDEYEAVGCYDDGGSRPLPVLLANLRDSIDWNDLNKTVDACAKLADEKGYSYFAVQFYGECWSGSDAGETYAEKGPSEDCVAGVGKAGTNFVYRLIAVEYKPVGCYDDGGSRPIPVLLANLRDSIDWNDLSKTVDACAKLADEKGYSYFAVQFYGECWSGSDAGETYAEKGPSEDCVAGVGKAGTNFVYHWKRNTNESF